jgi:hypothetical protein
MSLHTGLSTAASGATHLRSHGSRGLKKRASDGAGLSPKRPQPRRDHRLGETQLSLPRSPRNCRNWSAQIREEYRGAVRKTSASSPLASGYSQLRDLWQGCESELREYPKSGNAARLPIVSLSEPQHYSHRGSSGAPTFAQIPPTPLSQRGARGDFSRVTASGNRIGANPLISNSLPLACPGRSHQALLGEEIEMPSGGPFARPAERRKGGTTERFLGIRVPGRRGGAARSAAGPGRSPP